VNQSFLSLPIAGFTTEKRARFLFRIRREKARFDDVQLAATQSHGVLSQKRYMEITGNKVVAALAGTDNFDHVEEDDFVISLRTFEGGIERATERGCISPAYTVLKPSPEVEPKFYQYLLKSQVFISHLQTTVTGIRDGKSVKFENFANIVVPVPDLPTQRAIADFLDRETARIDLLIEKKQRLMELLREKTESINKHFFLNANVIETQPLHRMYWVVTGKTPPRNEENNFSLEKGVPWATPSNLGYFAPISVTKEYLTDNGCEGQPIVKAGTVLINGIGASVGKVGITGENVSFNQQIHALLSKNNALSDRFLFFQLITLREKLVLLANSSTLPILNGERLGRLELMVFEFEEQHRHCADMDALLHTEGLIAAKISDSIDRLREYRSALITAAVTGQIDVTKWVMAGTADRKLDAIQATMNT
jgi:type I restriction enzyme, S subunit